MKSLATFSFAGPSETLFVRHARVRYIVLSCRTPAKYPTMGILLIQPGSETLSGETTFNCFNGIETVSCVSGP